MRHHSEGLVMLVTLIVMLAAGAPAAYAAGDWRDKVEPAVLEAINTGPTEFMIFLTAKADLSAAARLASKAEKGAYVYKSLTAVAAASQAPLLRELKLLGAEYRSFWITNAIWVRADQNVLQTMALRPEVSRIDQVGVGIVPPPVGALEESPSGQLRAVEGNISQVGADQVWALGIRGQGAVVANADTGVLWTHAALKNQYRGWNGLTADHNYNWHLGASPDAVCPQFPSTEPCDDDQFLGGGHGTHTMGTIVGDDGLSNQIGMAPDAQWIACRNMDHGLGIVPFYLDCMQWFIAPTDLNNQNPDPSKAPHVVGNSWGCVEGCPPPVLKDTLEASRAAGIFYAVSAGNDGPDCSTLAFPLAIYEAAFSVGATNHRNDTIASFSSRGPILTDLPNLPRVGPDISAPGVTVRSALRNGGYGSLSGTSMASPHVTGLVALLISANPELAGDVDQLEQIIMDTAVPLTTSQGCGDDTPSSVPNNSFGWGRIDALAAVMRALELANQAPLAADDSASTEADTPVLIDVLANDSDPDGDPLTVTGVTDPPNGSATNNGDGTVTYTPDPGFASPPDDSFEYTISDGRGGSASAAVTVTVNSGPTAGPIERVHGSGFLLTIGSGSGDDDDDAGGSDKLNFSFDAEFDGAGGLKGKLKVNDKAAGVKIDAGEILGLSAGTAACNGVAPGPTSFELSARGKFNGMAGAVFRACGEDNGDPGKGDATHPPDRLVVECVSGCSYDTASRTPDDGLDGGNIHIDRAAAARAAAPHVIELDPILLTEAGIGNPVLLAASVHPDGVNLQGLDVTLNWTRTDGTGGSSQSLTDALGVALFYVNLEAGATEYIVRSGELLESNAIEVTATLG
ncbi:MAG TPA: S8 family serine peptidase, partial [Acidobacteriota bacterium]